MIVNSSNTILRTKEKKNCMLEYLFLFFAMLPFLFPNPIVTTNIQPYASIVGTMLVLLRFGWLRRNKSAYDFFAIGCLTIGIACIAAFFNPITVATFRAFYNYYAVLIIPAATVIAFSRIGEIPEKAIKILLLFWFGVALIQFVFYRGFMTQLISGVEWRSSVRGVVGLASEPSFLGISCYYFLHLVIQFRSRRTLYFVLTMITGVLLAQSAMGIMFISIFFMFFVLDMLNTRRGFAIFGAAVTGIAAFIIILFTRLTNTRLYMLVASFMNEGFSETISGDVSAENRFSAISNALQSFVQNWMLPQGFGARIGSGIGGFLCELGFFAIPIIFFIVYWISQSMNRRKVRLFYFIGVVFLLLNNTQIGNPLLLLVVGMNLFLYGGYERKGERVPLNP